MPWQTNTLEEQRKEVLALASAPGANRSELAIRFGISRKTLYKWLSVQGSGGTLSDRSRRPHTSPGRSSCVLEESVLGFREKHPTWGGRKIARCLLNEGFKVSPSTVTEILRRHHRLDGPKAGEKRDWVRFERPSPNELWQMDFKGHFPMTLGGRCHPFDCLDDRTRFCVALKACSDERSDTVKAHLISAFRTYGLPNAILCDNGGCWGSSGSRDVTPFTVWLSLLGIKVLHGRPHHPQTQGKEERFHRTLDQDVIQRRGFSNLKDCQKAFDRFRSDYNLIRPHDSLNLETPAALYTCSSRPYSKAPPKSPEYRPGDLVRKVQAGGILHLEGREFRVGQALRGQPVAIRPFERDGKFEVVFCRTRIEIIDLLEP